MHTCLTDINLCVGGKAASSSRDNMTITDSVPINVQADLSADSLAVRIWRRLHLVAIPLSLARWHMSRHYAGGRCFFFFLVQVVPVTKKMFRYHACAILS